MSVMARWLVAFFAIFLSAAPSLAGTYTSGFRWDAERRLVGMVAPDPDGAGPLGFPAERYTYDADGKLVLVEKGVLSSFPAESVAPSAWSGFTVQQQSAFAYDARGMQTETKVSSSGASYSITQTTYDEDGRLKCQAVRMDLAGAPAAGSDACLLDPTPGSDGADRISKTLYDAAGQTLQVRKALGTSLEQAYATYAYSANGKQTVVVDANGNRAEMVYDGYDRKTKWTFPSTTAAAAFNPATPASALASSNAVNAADYEQYGYDANDNRTSLRKRDGSTLTYDYDAVNRMTMKVVPSRADLTAVQTRDVFYGYDLRGLQTYARFDSASGDGLTSAYDKAGRLQTSTMLMAGTSRQLSYGYDLNSKRTSLTFPDTLAFSFSQDALNRMTGVYEGATPGPQLIGINYNNGGQRDLLGRANPRDTVYQYDPVSRLSALTNSSYGSSADLRIDFTYNPAGQLKTRARSNDAYAFTDAYNVNRNYSVNGLNQYTATSTGASYQYDANGNLTADGSTNYKYDIENRLVSASGANSATLTYDPMGRLYEVAGTSTTRFLYDGDALVGEYDGSGTMLRRYLHGSGVDEPLVWYEGGTLSTPRYLEADHQGSVILAADAAGATVGTNRYDEYGIPGAANIGRFQYTGQIWIPELGLYHYKARAYSPTLGRFLQTDPIGYDDQVNLYAYVGNDPMNGRDPSGLADVNLFSKSDEVWYSAAETFDPKVGGSDAIFSIMGHANEQGLYDFRDGKKELLTATALVEIARQNGLKDGQLILLTGCNCGGRYAQEVARISGHYVAAPDGFVSVSYKMFKKGDRVDLHVFSERKRSGKKGGFGLFTPKGKYLGSPWSTAYSKGADVGFTFGRSDVSNVDTDKDICKFKGRANCDKEGSGSR